MPWYQVRTVANAAGVYIRIGWKSISGVASAVWLQAEAEVRRAEHLRQRAIGQT